MKNINNIIEKTKEFGKKKLLHLTVGIVLGGASLAFVGSCGYCLYQSGNSNQRMETYSQKEKEYFVDLGLTESERMEKYGEDLGSPKHPGHKPIDSVGYMLLGLTALAGAELSRSISKDQLKEGIKK